MSEIKENLGFNKIKNILKSAVKDRIIYFAGRNVLSEEEKITIVYNPMKVSKDKLAEQLSLPELIDVDSQIDFVEHIRFGTIKNFSQTSKEQIDSENLNECGNIIFALDYSKLCIHTNNQSGADGTSSLLFKKIGDEKNLYLFTAKHVVENNQVELLINNQRIPAVVSAQYDDEEILDVGIIKIDKDLLEDYDFFEIDLMQDFTTVEDIKAFGCLNSRVHKLALVEVIVTGESGAVFENCFAFKCGSTTGDSGGVVIDSDNDQLVGMLIYNTDDDVETANQNHTGNFTVLNNMSDMMGHLCNREEIEKIFLIKRK